MTVRGAQGAENVDLSTQVQRVSLGSLRPPHVAPGGGRGWQRKRPDGFLYPGWPRQRQAVGLGAENDPVAGHVRVDQSRCRAAAGRKNRVDVGGQRGGDDQCHGVLVQAEPDLVLAQGHLPAAAEPGADQQHLPGTRPHGPGGARRGRGPSGLGAPAPPWSDSAVPSWEARGKEAGLERPESGCRSQFLPEAVQHRAQFAGGQVNRQARYPVRQQHPFVVLCLEP